MEWIKYRNDNDKEFLAEPRNRIHRLEKGPIQKIWAEKTGYTYTPITITPGQSLLDNFISGREELQKSQLYFWG